jgi:hypothetical protein
VHLRPLAGRLDADRDRERGEVVVRAVGERRGGAERGRAGGAGEVRLDREPPGRGGVGADDAEELLHRERLSPQPRRDRLAGTAADRDGQIHGRVDGPARRAGEGERDRRASGLPVPAEVAARLDPGEAPEAPVREGDPPLHPRPPRRAGGAHVRGHLAADALALGEESGGDPGEAHLGEL